MTSTWLITGGAGFIGSNFVRHAAEHAQARLVVLDLLTYAGNLANIADLVESKRVLFVKGDIRDEALVAELFSTHDFERVVHFAAESHVDRSILGPEAFLKTNVEGTHVLLQAARAAWDGDGDGRLFLHVSTDEVYGSLEPDDPPFHEDSPYRPSSPYSASKAASDHLVRAWHRTYGLPALITNCSNNYGPYQFPEQLIPLMILNAVEGRDLPVYGDGRQRRDWLHVEDHVTALMAALERGRPGATYLVGGEDERPNIDIVRAVCRAVDENLGRAPGTSEKLIRHVKDRPGHDRRYAIAPLRMREELGWRPAHTLEESLPRVVAWYLANRAWSDAIRSGEYTKYYELQYGSRS